MWWLHIKFVVSVVLLSVVLLCMYPLAKLTGKDSLLVTWKEVKSAYLDMRDNIYFK